MINKGYIINPAIGEEDQMHVKVIQKGVRMQVKLNKLKGAPIARFDVRLKKPYFEYPDGRKEYNNDGVSTCNPTIYQPTEI